MPLEAIKSCLVKVCFEMTLERVECSLYRMNGVSGEESFKQLEQLC